MKIYFLFLAIGILLLSGSSILAYTDSINAGTTSNFINALLAEKTLDIILFNIHGFRLVYYYLVGSASTVVGIILVLLNRKPDALDQVSLNSESFEVPDQVKRRFYLSEQFLNDSVGSEFVPEIVAVDKTGSESGYESLDLKTENKEVPSDSLIEKASTLVSSDD